MRTQGLGRTGAAVMMHDLNRREIIGVEPTLPQAIAEVHILVVKEKSLVHATNHFEVLSGYEDKSTKYPVNDRERIQTVVDHQVSLIKPRES
jgi:hypothetical protein